MDHRRDFTYLSVPSSERGVAGQQQQARYAQSPAGYPPQGYPTAQTPYQHQAGPSNSGHGYQNVQQPSYHEEYELYKDPYRTPIRQPAPIQQQPRFSQPAYATSLGYQPSQAGSSQEGYGLYEDPYQTPMYQPQPFRQQVPLVRQQSGFSQQAYGTPLGYQPSQVMLPQGPQTSSHTPAYAPAQPSYHLSTAPQGQLSNSPEGGVGSEAQDNDIFAPVRTVQPQQYDLAIATIVDQVDCFWQAYRDKGRAMPELPDYVKEFLSAHATAVDITYIKSVYERCENNMATKNANQGPAQPKPIPLTEQPPANLSWQQKRLWYEQRGYHMPGDTTAPRNKARVPQQKQIKPRTYANKFPWKPFANDVKLNTCTRYMAHTDRSRKPVLDGQGQIRRRSPRMPISSLLMDEDENQHPCHYVYETFKPCPYPNDFQCHANHNFSKEMMIWLMKERNLPILTANRLINCAMKNKPGDLRCNMSPITQRDLDNETPRGTMTNADMKVFWETHTIRDASRSPSSPQAEASKPNENHQARRQYHHDTRHKAIVAKKRALREAAKVKIKEEDQT